MKKEKHCEPDGLVYTSMPPQKKCKNCGQFWRIGDEIPVCRIQPNPNILGEWEVKLADENSPLGIFQKERTDAISEMFDGRREDGIYPTGRFFARLDKCVEALLSQQKQEMVEKIEEEIKAAHIDWQQDDIFLDGFKEGLKTAKVIITKQ